MHSHTLGRIKVRAGEILTFTYDESTPDKRNHITVVAIADIELSQEMATYCESIDRSTRAIYTEEALPGFIQYLTEKRLLHVGAEVSLHFGTKHRPATRLLNEHRFKINPEAFWEAKLTHRYSLNSFTVFNHQNHLLTVMGDVDAPFYILADVVDLHGELLGSLRLSVVSDRRHTLIDEDDIERLRRALQADLSLHVEELSVLIDRVRLIPNPEFGVNPFSRHASLAAPTPPILTPSLATPL